LEAYELFIAPFVPSPLPVIQRMLQLAELKPGEVLFDLGAGDGRTVIMAARTFSARAVGVELREDLAKKALSTIHDNGLADRVTIVNGDMFNVNLTSADVVFLYLTTSANEKVRPKLETELKKGVRVVSHDYEIVGWKPVKVDNFCENPQLGYPSHTIYLYKKP
jgi:predicted RNA methylase